MKHCLAAVALAIALLVAGCQVTPAPSPPGSNGGGAEVAATVVEPDDGARPIVEFIGQAKSSLDVGVYLLSDRDVIDAIRGAGQRGVRARVMLEEHPFGGGQGNATVYRQLEQAGIQVKWGNPTYRFNHEKVIVVDRKSVAIMTLNLTRSAFTRNREFAVITDEAAKVGEVQGIFDADWERRGFKPGDPDLVVSPENARGKLVGLIGRAQRSLDIYAEEMNEREIEGAIADAARRGVKVRVIMSPPDAGEKDSSQRGRQGIARAGAEVRLLEKPYVHAKIVLVDRKTVFVGSENFTATSLDQNRELGLLVASSATLERIQVAFEKDWGSGKRQ